MQFTANTFFFFNDTATTEIYTLSLHDALPICADQIANAMTHERIRYAVAPSEASGLADSDRKSTRLNSSHSQISYAVFCLKKKNFSKTTPAFDMIDSSVLELI